MPREQPGAARESSQPGTEPDFPAPANFLVPKHLRRGAKQGQEAVQLEQGRRLLDLVASVLNRKTLAGVDLLDFGCGTKVAEALLNNGIPVGSYVGVDVYREMIDYLNAHVSDPRFAFFSVDFHNEKYNPGGHRMRPTDELPVANRRFDAITAFSVFTHLAPEDFRNTLCVLRRYCRENGRLLFTLFIDRDAKLPFRDSVPDAPLLIPYYSEPYARELIQGTGWEALALHPPGEVTQHYFICRPV